MSLHEPIYPTTGLHFLDCLTSTPGPSDISSPLWTSPLPPALFPQSIIVVGAGLGGLSTALALRLSGHTVRVLEQATAFTEVGAGIQVPPNSTRHLLRWGVGPYLKDYVSEPFAIQIKRWEDGKVIGLTRLQPEFRREFKAPYFVVHRANLHKALLDRCREAGVQVNEGHGVVNYLFEAGPDSRKAMVVLKDGTTARADLIVAADGLKSVARVKILVDRDKIPGPTGNAAYRGTVDVAKMRADPVTAPLVETPNQHLWMGDRRHVMSYVIGGTKFNMVLSHPEERDPSTWKQETALEDMKKHFQGWDPVLLKTIGMLDKVLKWPLMSGEELPEWVHPSNQLLIVGDAAHAMVPYMSQGAAMAVEDAAALAVVLAKITSRDEMSFALKVFEKVRIERTSGMQQASLVNGTLWHFADGPEQKARDEAMRPEVEGRAFSHSPNQWSDPSCQWWTYGYEADKVMEKAWQVAVRDRDRLAVTKIVD